MKVLLVVDSFKGSMSSDEVNGYLEDGLKKLDSKLEIIKVPISDGGEGFVDSMVAQGGGKVFVEVTGPMGNKVDSFYGVSQDGATAYIEVAAAVGLYLLEDKDRNPLKTSSYGVGELIVHAANQGCKKIIIGLGGSSTNDGGMGMARALGTTFKDSNGDELIGRGCDLEKVSSIDITKMNPILTGVEFDIACDVDNPLLGQNGAAHVFAKQKGANEEMIQELESGMNNYRDIILKDLGLDVQEITGGGAAGGLCAALVAFLKGYTKRGIDIIINENSLEELVKEADLIITGEGKVDCQTLHGKAPKGILELGKKHNKRVIAIAGKIELDVMALQDKGFTDALCITPPGQLEKEAMKLAKENTLKITERIYSNFLKEC